MTRHVAALLGVSISCIVAAQVPVLVHDEGSKESVPYAHVSWKAMNSTARGVEVAGPDGKLTLPLDQATVQNGVAVRIDFIGYRALLDTLYTLAPCSFSLKHAQLFDLDPVVVTGQYRPTTADKAVQRMHVIGAEQIQRMAAQNLGDVLGQELNMRLTQDNVLGTSLSMRGMGGENVKILVDGVPVIGRQDGNLDLAQIDLTGIERVEILEGPLSVNYGTNALAGTINLITRKNTGNSSSLKAIAYVEPMGRLNLSVAAGQHFGKSDVLLSVGRNFFGGWAPGQSGVFDFNEHLADSTRYQPWKPREQYFGRLNYRYALNDQWTLNYKGEAMQDRITDRGLPRAPYEESAFDSDFLTQRFDNALFATGKLNKGRHIDALIAHDRYQRTRRMWIRDLTTLETQPVPGEADDSRFSLTNIRATYANANDSAKARLRIGLRPQLGDRGRRAHRRWQRTTDRRLCSLRQCAVAAGAAAHHPPRIALCLQHAVPSSGGSFHRCAVATRHRVHTSCFVCRRFPRPVVERTLPLLRGCKPRHPRQSRSHRRNVEQLFAFAELQEGDGEGRAARRDRRFPRPHP
jgi:outer membrane receptor for ferrienterochelin and colicins